LEELVAEAGYRAACATVRGNLQRWSRWYRLKRVPVDDFTSPSRLRWRLSPTYDLACRLRRWSRRWKGRVGLLTSPASRSRSEAGPARGCGGRGSPRGE
jgi:hypothetical protein